MKNIVLQIVFLLPISLSMPVMASLCESLPNHSEVESALKSVVNTTSNEKNGGLELHMWATVVARDGTVCLVTKTGKNADDQWLGSRVISAQKANTANGFSLPTLALSTANLWTATQPGGSLFGLQLSNPVNTDVAYRGEYSDYGMEKDPMVNGKIGGINVFGGGVALYNNKGVIVGGLGVSGDTSCADHNIAWKLRHKLQLDYVPSGVSPNGDDNIIYDSGNGFAHPQCGGNEKTVASKLPAISKVNQ
ncbi:MAG: GlcG/HbpS family heme-binding protein [Arenicella sp.]